MATTGGTKVLRFRGPPRSLAAAVPATFAPRSLNVRIELGTKGGDDVKTSLTARATRSGMVLRMSLPSQTPPGTYRGAADVEKGEVAVEVEPELAIELVPDQLTLQGAGGGRVVAEVTVANSGNVPAEIRGAYVFGLFAIGGFERALHGTFADPKAEERGPSDTLLDRMREEHGGVVRVAVEGAGDVAPGEARDLRLTLHLPADLAGGRTYTGTIPIHDLRYYVRLAVAEAKPTPTVRGPK